MLRQCKFTIITTIFSNYLYISLTTQFIAMNINRNEQEDELFYRIALSVVPGIGAKTAKTLLDKYGSAVAIFRTSLKELKNNEGIGEIKVKAFRDASVMQQAEKEWNYVSKNQVDLLCYKLNYPQRLVNCSDAPPLLYYKGNADYNTKKIIAVVGTRKNTDYGLKLCEDLVEQLHQLENVIVISGLALGIDAIAHKKALQMGVPTIGVLGHGCDMIYPHNHKSLVAQMVENGGILTEFPSGTLPDRNNFPMRNRIVAGMSDITVVIESGISGGALITAQMACGYNREVAAYPGRVNDKSSAGCNELIRSNTAAMITKFDDLADLMNWKNNKPKTVQRQLFITLSAEEQQLINILQTKDSVHADELFHQSGLSNSQLAVTLLNLEMQGLVKTLPGKYYRIN